MNEDLILGIELFVLGVIIWLAKHLANHNTSSPTLTYQQMIGKATLNGCTSLLAGLLVLVVSNPPTIALIALSAFFGSIGSEAVLKNLSKRTGIGHDDHN